MGAAVVVTAVGVAAAAAYGVYRYATRHRHDPASCPSEAVVLAAVKDVDAGTISLDAARARMSEWDRAGCASAVAAMRSIIAAKEAAATAKAGTGGKTAECEAAIVSLPTDALPGYSPPASLYSLAGYAVRLEKENDPKASDSYFNAAAAIDAEVLSGLAVKFAAASACLKARGVALGVPLTPMHAVLGHSTAGHRGMHRTGSMRRQDIIRSRMRG